jgi:hypothetical protein
MPRNTGEIEKAVSRTLRDALNALQRNAEDLNQALNDLIAACGSSRPGNSLPPILRAQTAAASLAASLEVLSRFVASSIQPFSGPMFAEEQPAVAQSDGDMAAPPPVSQTVPAPAPAAEELPATEPAAPEALPEPGGGAAPIQEPAGQDFATAHGDSPLDSGPVQTIDASSASHVAEMRAALDSEASPATAISTKAVEDTGKPGGFDVSVLLPEEQELHRRANRVAKVSMQDIKMLRPNEVRLGREHRDICLRLRDDIEKAHKEYDRRFQSILGHPVDYFYSWMVQILGDGDPETLGEYPYPSPLLHH